MAEPKSTATHRLHILATIRLAGGTKVSVVEPGKAADGINRRLIGSGGDIDRPYTERYTEIQDTLEAWRKNPGASHRRPGHRLCRWRRHHRDIQIQTAARLH